MTCGTDVRQYQVVWNYLWRAPPDEGVEGLNARVAGVGRARGRGDRTLEPGTGHRTRRAGPPSRGPVGSSEPCCGN